MRTASSLLTLIALFFLITPLSHARILNVPDDHQTIQAGIDAANVGDTVLVNPGVYRANLNLVDTTITLASLLLTTGMREYIDSTVIDGGNAGCVLRIDGGWQQQSRIVGLTIRNGRHSYGGGINCRQQVHPTFEDLVITDCEADRWGGGFYGSTTDWNNNPIRFKRTLFLNNRSDKGGGAGYTGNVEFVECEFQGNRADTSAAIHAGFAGMTLKNVLCIDNLAGTGNYIVMVPNTSIVIDGLTFAANRRENDAPLTCLRLGTNNESMRISNSIFWNLEAIYEIEIQSLAETLLDLNHCLIRSGRNGIFLNGNPTVSFDQDDLDLDPLFLDPENGDYRLSPDSPCIDAGDPDSPLDPDGTRADMGAFYFHQRDIEVESDEVHFPPMTEGEFDSLAVAIRNEGGTPLTITSILNCLSMSWIWTIEFPEGADSIIIQPDDAYMLWIYARATVEAASERTIFVTSNDPDEPEFTIEVFGEVENSVTDPQLSDFDFQLFPAYPNPFNASTTISFGLSKLAPTRLSVFDLSGREVAHLFDSRTFPPSHSHTLVWNAEGLPGGIYLIRLENGNQTRTMKTVLLR